MKTYTTPTITIDLTDESCESWLECDDIKVTLKNVTTLTFSTAEGTAELDEGMLEVTLTQAQTAALGRGIVAAELTFIDVGEVAKSETMEFRLDVALREEIEDD